MRGALGDAFLNWLICRWPHASLNADFCVFFYLQAANLLRKNGGFGFIGTKTIGQGDSARTGLKFLREHYEVETRHAISSFIWPGSAAVVAALVIVYKGRWNGEKLLDGRSVDFISEVLDSQGGWGEAKQLFRNVSRSFQGSVLVGLGFVLTEQEALEFLKQRAENAEVVKPFLSGEDLNSDPEQKASRWAIDFRDASLELCEKKWPELLTRIKELVKPQRDNTKRETHRRYWWHHGDKRPALYSCIKNREEVFVIASVTKYVSVVRVPANQIFLNKVYVFDLPGWSSFCALQSTFHDVWVRRGSSTVGETLNYTPSDYFDTYPFLHINGVNLEDVGMRYHELRKTIMKNRNQGLTNTYNQFHDQQDASSDIRDLRNLQIEMDLIVANAYGWADLNCEHGFYETKQGMRFTISEKAKRDVLQRLLIINHQQFDDEISLRSQEVTHTKKSTKRGVMKIDSSAGAFGDLFAGKG